MQRESTTERNVFLKQENRSMWVSPLLNRKCGVLFASTHRSPQVEFCFQFHLLSGFVFVFWGGVSLFIFISCDFLCTAIAALFTAVWYPGCFLYKYVSIAAILHCGLLFSSQAPSPGANPKCLTHLLLLWLAPINTKGRKTSAQCLQSSLSHWLSDFWILETGTLSSTLCPPRPPLDENTKLAGHVSFHIMVTTYTLSRHWNRRTYQEKNLCVLISAAFHMHCALKCFCCLST